MAEDISVQILAQTSENIQKLFDLSTRIDERVKAIQNKQGEMDDRIAAIVDKELSIMQKIAVLESLHAAEDLEQKVDEISDEMNEFDKRLAKVESDSGRSSERWKTVATFVVQLIWVILAAYLLTTLHLQAPNIP